jgi:cellulose synthase/poly-beta-1,6-N-acetylglucosamine synthase-like glycosyltransferase
MQVARQTDGSSGPLERPSLEVIVPEFNELTRQGGRFDSQIAYLSELSKEYPVILIDDASTDGSWDRIMELSPSTTPRLRFHRMSENGQKILAVKHAVESSDADYVFLSDFDSMIANTADIPAVLRKFTEDDKLAGVSLKLVPEGDSIFSMFQDIEYAIQRRIFGSYLTTQGRMRCIPGAGGIWDRKILLEVLQEHSGRHNGDDLESTAIALRNGYSAINDSSIVVKTLVPQGVRALYKQRKRWELGSLETYSKERQFYVGQAKDRRNRLGHVTMLDWYFWFAAILTPVFIIDWIFNPEIGAAYLILQGAVSVVFTYISRKELKSERELMLLPLFAFYQFLAMVPRIAALFEMLGRWLPAHVAGILHEIKSSGLMNAGPRIQASRASPNAVRPSRGHIENTIVDRTASGEVEAIAI